MNVITQSKIVTIDNLTRTYRAGENQIHALKNVNLEINRGELIAIMGPSGSGKSTLMHLIGGLDRPTDGTVSINGKAINTLSDQALSQLRRHDIGFVFQFYNLMSVLTARENVAMPLLLDGVKRREALVRADAVLAQVGLLGREHSRPTELSGGQQQRVSIARALVINPALILADEPTGALDSETGQEIIRILRQLVTESGHTVVMVTHDARVAAHASRIINLKDGRIVDDNRLSPLATKPSPTSTQAVAI